MSYRISADTMDEFIVQMNLILKKIDTDISQLRGLSGDVPMEARSIHSDDVIFTSTDKGVVLKDDGNPPQYWRVWVNSSGTLSTETMDPQLKD